MPKKNGQPTKAELRRKEMQEKLLNDDFVIENKRLLNWRLINKEFKVSDNVLINCKDCVKWTLLCQTQKINLDILKKFYKKITPYQIIVNLQEIDLELLRLMESRMEPFLWIRLSSSYELDFKIIDEFKDKLALEFLRLNHLCNEQRELVESWIILQKLG